MFINPVTSVAWFKILVANDFWCQYQPYQETKPGTDIGRHCRVNIILDISNSGMIFAGIFQNWPIFETTFSRYRIQWLLHYVKFLTELQHGSVRIKFKFWHKSRHFLMFCILGCLECIAVWQFITAKPREWQWCWRLKSWD